MIVVLVVYVVYRRINCWKSIYHSKKKKAQKECKRPCIKAGKIDDLLYQ